MTQQAPSNPLPAVLLRARDGLILHQTLYVAAKLGVTDSLEEGWHSAGELARELLQRRRPMLSHARAGRNREAGVPDRTDILCRMARE